MFTTPRKTNEKTHLRSVSPNASEYPKPDEPAVSLNFSELYRFATFGDKILLAFGVVMSTFSGVLLPMTAVVFDAVDKVALDYFLIAVGLFFAEYLPFVSFHYRADRQMKALRTAALRHMLYLDVSW